MFDILVAQKIACKGKTWCEPSASLKRLRLINAWNVPVNGHLGAFPTTRRTVGILYVEVRHKLRVLFNEQPARLHFIPHQPLEDVVREQRVFDGDLQNRA